MNFEECIKYRDIASFLYIFCLFLFSTEYHSNESIFGELLFKNYSNSVIYRRYQILTLIVPKFLIKYLNHNVLPSKRRQ